MSNFSYEEIQKTTYVVLSNESWMRHVDQYSSLSHKVASLFQEREGRSFDTDDEETFREVFSELFRSGIIMMGLNSANPNLPFFKVTQLGKKLLVGNDPYFFHDVASYEKIIKEQVNGVDDLTILYLKEAMQAFRSNCILSASVMLGVAAEHDFTKLMETIESNERIKGVYANAFKERGLLRKFNKFQKILEQGKQRMPLGIKEDMDTVFVGILSILRTFRNESGHPTGKIISREQCHVLLSIYPSYCKKVYQMMGYFEEATA